MPTLVSPSSSQEIVAISPPFATTSSRPESSTTLPVAVSFTPHPELKPKIREALRAYQAREAGQNGKRKAKVDEIVEQRKRIQGMDRSRVTEHMMNTMGKASTRSPIPTSIQGTPGCSAERKAFDELDYRTDHFVSAATGHQQSNRGGGSSGAATYWEVRTAKMADQARAPETGVLRGCVCYINGSTGPRVSNLQLQNIITSNGGRFTPTQNSSCTHIIASGGLSGTKTQKFIKGQGGRGASRRAKVVRVEWVLDCVERKMKLSEAGYGVIQDPSQNTLFMALGVKPKLDSEVKAEGLEAVAVELENQGISCPVLTCPNT